MKLFKIFWIEKFEASEYEGWGKANTGVNYVEVKG